MNTIETQIEILHDLCIINRRAKKKTEAVFNILKACKNEYEIEQKLHDVKCGDKDIDTFIKQYGSDLKC